GLAGEGAVVVSGQAYDPAAQLAQGANQANNLLTIAAVRQDQGDVVRVDHAEIAVNGAGCIHHVRAGAGGAERAGQLLADVGRFARASDCQPARTGANQLHRVKKSRIKAAGDKVQGGRLRFEDRARVAKHVVQWGKRLGV